MPHENVGALEVSETGLEFLARFDLRPRRREKAESIRVIRGAHDLGVTWLILPRSTVQDTTKP